MDYIFLVITILASIHGYTFAQWLGKGKNKLGMMGVLFLVMVSLSLSIYHIMNAS